MADLEHFGAGLWRQASRTMAYNAGVWASQGQAVLIDPGVYPVEIDHLVQGVAGLDAKVVLVILTHSHWDHLLGPKRLQGSPRLAAHISYRDQAQIHGDHIGRQVANWEKREILEETSPFVMPEPTLWLKHGDEIDVGALRLTCLHVPGHAADQLALLEVQSGVLWAADILSDVEIPFVSHSLRSYQQTLRQLAGLTINGLIPGHGTPAATHTAVAERLSADLAYLNELSERVTTSITAGKSAVETVSECAGMRFRHQDAMKLFHQFNIESAYVELGGPIDRACMGWDREWTEAMQ